VLLGACSGLNTDTPTPEPAEPVLTQAAPTNAPSSFTENYIPPYYLASYAAIVENSKTENGLVIYSVMDKDNWKPILELFHSHYPWINVTITGMEATEVFNRYLAETTEGAHTADLLISSDVIGWQDFIGKGEVLTYRSQEELFLPAWATRNIGLYVISSDPLLIIYNRGLISTPPRSIAELAHMTVQDPAGYQQQILTYDAEIDTTGFAVNWFWLNQLGETGWSELANIGDVSPTFTLDRNFMVDSVGMGTSKIGYFVTSTVALRGLQTYPDLSYTYISDGQPLLLNYIAITQKSASQNSAKLFVDFILSQEGQVAVSLGGLTSYRPDVAEIATNHLNKVEQAVGTENLIFLYIDPPLADPEIRNAFLERWKLALKKISPP
jgi:iron(III) transport system substrate-binding protein